MLNRRTVYVGNLKEGVDEKNFKSFLHQLGYKNFDVQMCMMVSPCRGAFCLVLFDKLIDANKLRNELLEVSAQM